MVNEFLAYLLFFGLILYFSLDVSLLFCLLLFDVPQCPVCQHEFVSAEYLQSHIHRQHPEHLSLARREGEEKKK